MLDNQREQRDGWTELGLLGIFNPKLQDTGKKQF